MEKINFEDLPSKNTPINATNLNQIQTNVENEFEKTNNNVSTLDTKVGDLTTLNTTDQTSAVNAINEVNTKLEDSGWHDIPLADGVTAGTIGERPQYRKVGKRVDIKGSYSFTKSSANDLVGVLPEGFRPTGYIYLLSPVGGSNVMRVFIQSNGNIYSEWIYGLTTDAQTTGKINWCDIRTSFYVD